MIKKSIKGLYNILGWPYHAVIKLIKAVWAGIKLGIKGLKKFVMNLPKIAKFIGKWFVDAIKESIAQIFTILGFFIAWFTLSIETSGGVIPHRTLRARICFTYATV